MTARMSILTGSLLARRLAHRAKMLRRGWSRPAGQHAIVVLSAGRDGSNLLVDYLNNLDSVQIVGEVLNPALPYGLRERWISPAATLRHVRRSLRAIPAPHAGVKIHFAQLRARGLTADHLHQALPEARLIILYRQSIADQFVSLKLAVASGQWVGAAGRTQPRDLTLRIDEQELLDYCRTIRGYYEQLCDQPWVPACSLWLSYEQLSREAQAIFSERVLPFLGLPAAEVRTRMVKQNTRDLPQVVENYHQVKDLLTGELTHHTYLF